MEIKLVKIEKNTAYLTISIDSARVSEEETHTLESLASETTLKGFRKGKAPLNLVKASLDPERIKERTVNHLLGHVLNDAIEEHKLKVIANPRLTKSETDKDTWTFELELPLYPEIKLGDYADSIKKAVAKAKPKDDDAKLKVVFDTLLDTIEIDIPDALIEEEVNHSLSRLVSQAQTLNLSITDYLKSLGKNAEQLREEYTKTATESLKLDFVIFAVAQEQKITVSEAEVEELQKTAQTKPEQAQYLKSILMKRKAVDYLLKL